MKKIKVITLVLLSFNSSAQEYFQQEVNYTIDVVLNDQDHTLKGIEHIDYTNNSNNDLNFLWFHIWPNAYKDNTTALAKQKTEDGSTSLYYTTEEGVIDFNNYTNVLRFNIYLNLGTLNFG